MFAFFLYEEIEILNKTHILLVKSYFFKLLRLYKNNILMVSSLLLIFYFCLSPLLKLNFVFGSDDDWILLNNPEVIGFSFSHILHYFTTVYNGQYSPVNTIFYGLIYKINGFNAFNFYLALLSMHTLNALLVFRFFTLIVERSSLSVRFPYRLQFMIAYSCALFFYINPIQIETYTWVSASKVILYTFFILLCMIAYVNFLKNKSFFWYSFTIFSFLLACSSKEQAVILPLVLLLIDYYILKYFLSKKQLFLKVPFFIISLLMGLYQLSFQKLPGIPVAINNESQVFDNLWLSFSCIGEYYINTLIPSVSVKNGSRIVSDQILHKFQFVWFLVFVILFYLTFFSIIKKKREIIFGIGLTFISLLFTLPIFPIVRSSYIADRYMYLGCVGIFYPIAVYLLSNCVKMKTVGLVIICLYVSYLFILTYFNCQNRSIHQNIFKSIVTTVKR